MKIQKSRRNPNKFMAIGLAAGLALIGIAGCSTANNDTDVKKPVTGNMTKKSKDTKAGNHPYAILGDDAIAYAEVNFNPSLEQKATYLKLNALLAKQGLNSSDGDFKATVFKGLSDTEDQTYAELESIVGDRAAVSAFPDANDDGEPELFVTYAVTDVKAAKALADKDTLVTVDGEYATIALNDSVSGAHAKAKAKLGDNKVFNEDRELLGGGNDVGFVWLNVNETALPPEARGDLESIVGVSPELNEPIEVRLGSTIAILDNGINVTAEIFSSNTSAIDLPLGKPDAGKALLNQPADTAVALSWVGLDDFLEGLFKSLPEGYLDTSQYSIEEVAGMVGDITTGSINGDLTDVRVTAQNGNLAMIQELLADFGATSALIGDDVVVNLNLQGKQIAPGAATDTLGDVSKIVPELDKAIVAFYADLTKVSKEALTDMGITEDMPVSHLGFSIYENPESKNMRFSAQVTLNN